MNARNSFGLLNPEFPYLPAASHSDPAAFRERMKRRAYDIERAKRELERQQADEIAANDEGAE